MRDNTRTKKQLPFRIKQPTFVSFGNDISLFQKKKHPKKKMIQIFLFTQKRSTKNTCHLNNLICYRVEEAKTKNNIIKHNIYAKLSNETMWLPSLC